MEKFCQSCAMPLMAQNQDLRGYHADGTRSEDYCYLCYLNGHFTEADITFEQMLAKGKAGIQSSPGNPLVKWLMLVSYPIILKKVKRWRR
ncbi:zinc ribbon domain-containing protein [Streptococcus pseudoporcinus]|uniref:Zinc ribbon domain n=2 Tax=Streptococcus pseudoporcinus TaxID=361101 RepID=A0A4U9ZPK4_9STRE|nr:zinc ribbon domain-containing protein [Streptococcus pseudoporcinus]EFR43623.1 hypothetical protein HMPREF9320_1221 [Streptococcus pseudoporcinus SPIN 20026]EHI65527.1 hypothetical protein STRPS_0776 [Streptococcus pseudoporcinus LQ 940-04]VEF93701.1 Putative zinc ribbon domain [Streptococcus pseudoporcinus]VTS41614.1 Putative zinc ribbon domain [Streptococcus pseudoporcinus]